MNQRTCSIGDCDRTHDARGMCATHYRRWQRNGDPLFLTEYQTLRTADIETRFLAKVDVLPSECWQWRAGSNGRYGQFKEDGVGVLAHRWAYEHWVGPIPDGLHIDHYRYPQDGCIGTLCVNPEHLRPATPRENILRGDSPVAWNAAQIYCPQAHPYAGDNLRIKRSGARACRACARAAEHKQLQE